MIPRTRTRTHPGGGALITIVGAEDDAAQSRRGTFAPLLGYTELRTDSPGGRDANVRTMRAMVVSADGTGPRELGYDLIDGTNTWTQFAGWSPAGMRAVIARVDVGELQRDVAWRLDMKD